MTQKDMQKGSTMNTHNSNKIIHMEYIDTVQIDDPHELMNTYPTHKNVGRTFQRNMIMCEFDMKNKTQRDLGYDIQPVFYVDYQFKGQEREDFILSLN